MMVMTAKVDIKKVLAILAAAVALIIGLIALLNNDSAAATSAPAGVSTNDDRVRFLNDLGWDVVTSPADTGQARIPGTSGEVFDRYNALQKTQGYDLSPYAGKTVMRYVYQIKDYPGAEKPVYATLLVFKNQIIGGDITDTSEGGKIQGLKKPTATTPESASPAA